MPFIKTYSYLFLVDAEDFDFGVFVLIKFKKYNKKSGSNFVYFILSITNSTSSSDVLPNTRFLLSMVSPSLTLKFVRMFSKITYKPQNYTYTHAQSRYLIILCQIPHLIFRKEKNKRKVGKMAMLSFLIIIIVAVLRSWDHSSTGLFVHPYRWEQTTQ